MADALIPGTRLDAQQSPLPFGPHVLARPICSSDCMPTECRCTHKAALDRAARAAAVTWQRDCRHHAALATPSNRAVAADRGASPTLRLPDAPASPPVLCFTGHARLTGCACFTGCACITGHAAADSSRPAAGTTAAAAPTAVGFPRGARFASACLFHAQLTEALEPHVCRSCCRSKRSGSAPMGHALGASSPLESHAALSSAEQSHTNVVIRTVLMIAILPFSTHTRDGESLRASTVSSNLMCRQGR